MGNPTRTRGWYANQAGTRYVRDKAPPAKPKEKPIVPSKALMPLLKGEAEGDLDLAVVMAVRNLIRTPADYVRNMRACSRSGQVTDPTSPDAVRWNIFGALECVTHPNFTPAQKRFIILMIKENLPAEWRTRLFMWEEDKHTTHAQVVNLLNQTIGARKKAIVSDEKVPTSTSAIDKLVQRIVAKT